MFTVGCTLDLNYYAVAITDCTSIVEARWFIKYLYCVLLLRIIDSSNGRDSTYMYSGGCSPVRLCVRDSVHFWAKNTRPPKWASFLETKEKWNESRVTWQYRCVNVNVCQWQFSLSLSLSFSVSLLSLWERFGLSFSLSCLCTCVIIFLGSLFTRWGRSDCPTTATLIYKGIVVFA